MENKIKISILALCLFIFITLIFCFSKDGDKFILDGKYKLISIVFSTFTLLIAINLLILKFGGISMNVKLKSILISVIFLIFDCIVFYNGVKNASFFGAVFVFVTIILIFFESQYFELFTIVLANSFIFLGFLFSG